MMHQTTFAHAEFTAKKKRTRREQFLERMEGVIPWAALLAVIEPHYPKGGRGRPPMGLERMLRVYFLQQWYGLADEALEDSQALHASRASSCTRRACPTPRRCSSSAGCWRPTTCARRFSPRSTPTSRPAACSYAKARWRTPRSSPRPARPRTPGANAPPHMHQTKKGNQWHFGLKAHIGADRDGKLVHSLVVTAGEPRRCHPDRRAPSPPNEGNLRLHSSSVTSLG